jgi:hypothetical protein
MPRLGGRGLSAVEGNARSRLLRLIHNSLLLHGSLVTMARTCGKENCKCQRGDKHVSLYVSALAGKTRKMIYVPPDLETQVREWVRAYQEAHECLEKMPGECVKRLQAAKEKRTGPGSRRP